jgi:predicted AlkP superfamily phosphohydrolase/phosphomutase
LQTEPPHFLSLVWSTLFCGSRVGEQCWYFNKIWNPDRQRLQYVDPAWLPVQPFWLSLDPSYRLAILDLPYGTELPTRPNMTTLNGWQCHDAFGRNALPPDLWARLSERHGKPRLTAEVFGPQSAATLLAQRQEVLEGNRQFGDICRDLLTHDRFDLFLAVFGLVHRGTHYLWDLSQIDPDDGDGPTRAVLEGGLHDCYTSADEALGRVLDAAPPDARVVVFALHGMGPNDGWYEFLPRILEQIHRGGGGAPAKPGLLFRLRQALPWTLVRQVTRRIPAAWNKALVPLWSHRMHDWPNTKYFALPMDYNGYVRLNLKGRDQQGCVDPEDADRVIAEVDAALRSFRDITTGKPVIGARSGGRVSCRAVPFLPIWSCCGTRRSGGGVQRRIRPVRRIRWPGKLAPASGNHPMAGSSPGTRSCHDRAPDYDTAASCPRLPVARRAPDRPTRPADRGAAAGQRARDGLAVDPRPGGHPFQENSGRAWCGGFPRRARSVSRASAMAAYRHRAPGRSPKPTGPADPRRCDRQAGGQ